MAKKKKETTEQFNVNLPSSLVKRLREYCNHHWLQPTYTQVTVAALTQYLDAEQQAQSARPKK